MLWYIICQPMDSCKIYRLCGLVIYGELYLTMQFGWCFDVIMQQMETVL